MWNDPYKSKKENSKRKHSAKKSSPGRIENEHFLSRHNSQFRKINEKKKLQSHFQ